MLACLVAIVGCGNGVHGHGRLIEPAARGTMWRFAEYADYDPPVNYDDNELYCGGFGVQYVQNGGKCGIATIRLEKLFWSQP